MSRRLCFLAAGLIFLLSVAGHAAETTVDEQILKAARMGTDEATLLGFFRARTLTDENRARLEAWMRQLGDDSFGLRQKASAALVALGPSVLPLLQPLVSHEDSEVARRARECIRQIVASNPSSMVPAAAVRLLAERRPPQAVETLLRYLPYADDEGVADEVRNALTTLAVRKGHVDPALVQAFADASPIRRAAAAEALGRAGARAHQPALLRLLHDPDPMVRLRVALVLARAQERSSIPVLIDLLGQVPPAQAGRAEDVLCRLAQDQTPAVSLGRDPDSRRRCRDAWAGWWRDHGSAIDLAVLVRQPRLLGYTMIVLLDDGVIQEIGPDSRPRWQVNGLKLPLDAQLLGGDRLLVAEHDANRVTERTLRGEIVWEKALESPLVAQRLANGNTFIATRNRLLEFDPAGTEVFRHPLPPGENVMKAQKLSNGETVYVSTFRKLVRLDPDGAEIARFDVDVRTSGGRVEALPNGHLLVPQLAMGKVVEYDATGRVIAELPVEQPVAAVRLPNGHTLVTSLSQRRAIEFDRLGQEVWEYRADGARVTRAWRR